MGGLMSWIVGFCSRMFAIKARIVMFGLYGAGKTTILYRLTHNQTVAASPSIGFNVETWDLTSGVIFTVWDICIGYKGWPLLRHYLSGSHGILFVVDSTDSERFHEVKELLFILLNSEISIDMPLLVLANKQDMEGAHSPVDIAQFLDLENLTYRQWAVFGCCGTDGRGLPRALETFATMIKER